MSRPHSGGTEWKDAAHAEQYLEITCPHFPAITRTHEEVVRELVAPDVERVLDLGCGDGRLLAIALSQVPKAAGVGLDFSAPMLDRARTRFAEDPLVTFHEHDLRDPLPDLGPFDLILSGFAIHHVDDERKRALYGEVLTTLTPGGRFVNVEHVASPTPHLHAEWMHAMGLEREDPSNLCAPVADQLAWLRDLGYVDVDCLWKWREMALLCGSKPA